MRGRWLKVLMVVLVLVPVGLTAYLASNLYHRKGVPEALENLTRQLFRSKEDERKAEARAVELERKAGELQTAYDALVADLRGEVDSRDIRVRQFREKLEINFVDKVLFASGSAEITPRGRAILLKVGGVLNKVKDKSIYVVGHTDANPIHSALYPSNWELSTARSASVIRFLSEEGGLTPERFTAMGRAFYQPVASNATPEGRQENRRVDVIIADVPLLSSETGSESVRGTASGQEPAAQTPAPGQEPLRESAPPPPGPNEPITPTPSPSSQEEATSTPSQAEPAPATPAPAGDAAKPASPADEAKPATPAADAPSASSGSTTPAAPDAASTKPASPSATPDLPPALPDKPAPGK